MHDDFFEDEDGDSLDVTERQELFLSPIEHPMPKERLGHIMREGRIQYHRIAAEKAVREIQEFGQITPETQTALQFGRFSLPNYGVEAIAEEIEREAGLPSDWSRMS